MNGIAFNGQPKATYLPQRVAYGYRLNENRLTLDQIDKPSASFATRK
ncbi:hypothetical protein RSSM_01218 [Rhodopirellula sallentina SM41]|uniref:Uncharacterized protein n=1 Tax=Rhodopirellula sallentina SM41 TaxID=1263870 RepID=M5U7C0_9BACT|nr:hypothetical protein RSSM_01218 [Rhodopirellula sallentina SM41]